MPLFASLCAHGRRFGAHLGTQTDRQHNQAPPHEKSPQHHFLGFKGLIAALADIYLHFKGLLFVNPPYIDGDIPPLILRILADSNPSKRR